MNPKGRMVPATRWSNIGGWLELWRGRPSAGLRTPWGNVIVKSWNDRLFSERYGYTRTLKVGPICVTWVRLRRFLA